MERPLFAPSFPPVWADRSDGLLFTPKTLYKVECPISLKTKSVRLVPSATSPGKVALCFEGKCLKPCKLQMYENLLLAR